MLYNMGDIKDKIEKLNTKGEQIRARLDSLKAEKDKILSSCPSGRHQDNLIVKSKLCKVQKQISKCERALDKNELQLYSYFLALKYK